MYESLGAHREREGEQNTRMLQQLMRAERQRKRKERERERTVRCTVEEERRITERAIEKVNSVNSLLGGDCVIRTDRHTHAHTSCKLNGGMYITHLYFSQYTKEQIKSFNVCASECGHRLPSPFFSILSLSFSVQLCHFSLLHPLAHQRTQRERERQTQS